MVFLPRKDLAAHTTAKKVKLLSPAKAVPKGTFRTTPHKIGAVDRAGSLHAYIPPASNSAILVIIQSVALNKVHKKKPLWNLFMDIGCESVGCLFVALK